MRTQRLLAATTASLLLAALTGCGADATPASTDTPEVDSASSQPVEPAEDESPQEDESPEKEDGGYEAEELLAALKAAVAENESAHLTMEIGQNGQSMTGEGDVSYAGDTTAMQMRLESPEMGGTTVEVRLVDGFMYMAMPPMTPQGKFIKVDVNNPDSPLGDLGGVTEGDPLATFEAFDAGLTKAEYVGEEDVDGEDMDHYVLTVDARKAAKAQGNPVGPGTPKTITYDLWIDDEDLMRRMEFTEAGAGMTMTMDDWGKPVEVTAPPAATIMQMPGVTG